jgi:hypothetical protein
VILLAFSNGCVNVLLLLFCKLMDNEELRTRVFLTDGDFAQLFGGTIAGLVRVMNEAAKFVCPACNGYCCKNIRCLLYSEKFSSCPIFDIRPRECRYHFCNDVFKAAPLTKEEKDKMQQPVEELICGNRGQIAQLFFGFPDFPLDEKGLEAMGIRASVERIMRDFAEGRLTEETLKDELRRLCRG